VLKPQKLEHASHRRCDASLRSEQLAAVGNQLLGKGPALWILQELIRTGRKARHVLSAAVEEMQLPRPQNSRVIPSSARRIFRDSLQGEQLDESDRAWQTAYPLWRDRFFVSGWEPKQMPCALSSPVVASQVLRCHFQATHFWQSSVGYQATCEGLEEGRTRRSDTQDRAN
jgi:hypothetical protein